MANWKVNLIDSVVALIQTFLFAIVSAIECLNEYSLGAYFVIFVASVLYIFFGRDRLIRKVLYPKGIPVSYQAEHLRADFENVLESVIKLRETSQVDFGNQYFLFVQWRKLARIVIRMFYTEGNTVKNIRIKSDVRISEMDVYVNELFFILDELIWVFERNYSFKQVVLTYNCKLFSKTVEDESNILRQMKEWCENKAVN